jgi:hypothetical protein
MSNSTEKNKKADKPESKLNVKPEQGIEKQEHVGIHTMVRLRGFNNDQPINGKVDTGAETSSLHAGDLQISSDHRVDEHTASFTFGSNRYRVPIVGWQAVSSADGGTTRRPIVTFTVYIADEVIPDVEFNLNDRSQMEYELLIGLNLIQAAKLKVDPSLREMEINFSAPIEQPEDSQETPGVDNPPATVDNDESDAAFLAWYKANKDKTVAELFSQLIDRSTPDDAS